MKVEISLIDFDALAPRAVDAVRFVMRSRESATRERVRQSLRCLAPTRSRGDVELSRTRSLVDRVTMSGATDHFVLLLLDYFSCARALESRKMFRFGDLAAELSAEKLEESDFGSELRPDTLAASFVNLKGCAAARARATLACISQHPVCLLTAALYPNGRRPRSRVCRRGPRRSRAPSCRTSRAAQDAVRRAAWLCVREAPCRARVGLSVGALAGPLGEARVGRVREACRSSGAPVAMRDRRVHAMDCLHATWYGQRSLKRTPTFTCQQNRASRGNVVHHAGRDSDH